MSEDLTSPLDEATRIAKARNYLDTAELWLRRLVHDRMNKTHGPSYFNVPIIKSSIVKSATDYRQKNPGRFPRDIDATSLEQLVEIICNENNWVLHFKDALVAAYPNGPAEAKTFLTRLIDVRNTFGHVNGCSMRQLERAVCYTNDLVESLKADYVRTAMNEAFKAPTFTRFTDNHGKVDHLSIPANGIGEKSLQAGDLWLGDRLVVEVEVDPTFDEKDYIVVCSIAAKSMIGAEGKAISIDIDMDCIGESLCLIIEIRSRNSWNRFSRYHEKLYVRYRVFPTPR